ncbi:MAG: glycerol-3-phosphate dehydrogenase [Methylocystis sp.]|nr:glycerol-3-phosphate dehydrogenase [Methylocystis sp.]
MTFDLIIVGGGVNGCAIARDAAGRGLDVLLLERQDLASGTSSASTKLIHGGLRYLEHYEFRLVHEALEEREILLAAAGHVIWPLRFVLPHERGVRPAWLVRLGLFLYDHLARRKRLPGSRMVELAGRPFGAPLRQDYKLGFTYFDCWVDDARLVVLEALDAHERGADVRVGAKLTRARREGDLWIATTEDDSGRREEASGRVLVDAAGPWVSDVLQDKLRVHSAKHVRLVKGSHLVLRKLYEGDHAYILQLPDKRVMFAIPFEDDFTLIGTTDIPHMGALDGVAISAEETRYLLDGVNHFFRRTAAPADIVWSYAGLRPLYDDGSLQASVVTRDYAFDLDAPHEGAPVLAIFGGKITTARRLAEHALDALTPFFPHMKPAWTKDAALPGGDLGSAGFEAFLTELLRRKPFLEARVARRLARAYGARVWRFLDQAHSMADLGRDFGFGLTEAELSYLHDHEWARSVEDILWRRSKLGLHLTGAQQQALAQALGEANSGGLRRSK